MDDDVTLSDGVVSLRPFQMSDTDELTEAVRESIPELKPWMSWCHDDYSEDDTRNWIKSLPSGWVEGLNLVLLLRIYRTEDSWEDVVLTILLRLTALPTWVPGCGPAA